MLKKSKWNKQANQGKSQTSQVQTKPGQVSWTPETQPNDAVRRRLVEFLVFNRASRASQPSKPNQNKQAKQTKKASKQEGERASKQTSMRASEQANNNPTTQATNQQINQPIK